MKNSTVLAFTRFQNDKDLILHRNERGVISLDLRFKFIPIPEARTSFRNEELAYKTFEKVSQRMEIEERVLLPEQGRDHEKKK